MEKNEDKHSEDFLGRYFHFEKEHIDACEAERVNILVYNVTHIDVYFGIRCSSNKNTILARATFSKFFETTRAVLNTIVKAKASGTLNPIKMMSKEGEERLIGFDLSATPVCSNGWDDFRLRKTPTDEENYMKKMPEIVAVYFPLVAVMLPVWLKLLNLPNKMLFPKGNGDSSDSGGGDGNSNNGNGSSQQNNNNKRKANINDGGNNAKIRVVSSNNNSASLSQKKDRIENNDKIRLSISSPTITHSNNNDNKYSISSGKGKSATFSSGSIFTTTATSPRRLRDTTSTPSKKIYTVIYMTSGSGSPRNQSHSHTGNSTLEASKMLGIFMQSMFPFVHPVSVHSGSGVYRCTHNVTFVNTILRPKIDQHRQALSRRYGGDWHYNMKIAVALTDGTPARLAAITASLRNYRPIFLHMWQLKSFWYSRLVSDSDVDTQTFEDWETRPAVGMSQLTSTLSSLVKSMVDYKKKFETASHGSPGSHELDTFWLRKSRKPVLSVLMLKNNNGNDDGDQKNSTDTNSKTSNEYKFIYGINSEVSMPTGSLCSERNAIGHALASNPCLKRSDLVAIAVLSVCLRKNDSNHLNPLSPCGACLEWLKKIAEYNPDFKVVMFGDTECKSVFVRSVHGL